MSGRQSILMAGLLCGPLAIAPTAVAQTTTDYFGPELRAATVECSTGLAATIARKPVSTQVISPVELEWFSKQLIAAKEPSLYEQSRRPDANQTRTYRFTWLRSFHEPMIVRIDETGDGAVRLTAKRLSGKGGYEPGDIAESVNRDLTPTEAIRVRQKIAALEPDKLAPRDCRMGFDGAEWVVEAASAGRNTVIIRWAPKEGGVRDLGETFLRLTGFSLDPIY